MGRVEPGSADVAERISDEIAAIHRESYGEPVRSVTTHIHDDSVVCVLDITLLPHERTLIEKGRGQDSILMLRRQFQQAIAPTFAAAVEHMTGRRVIGFLGETHIDPSFSVEFFKLAPSM
jgi:uncharacterized protein YbcI